MMNTISPNFKSSIKLKIFETLASHHLLVTRNQSLALRYLLKAKYLGSLKALGLIGFFYEFGLAELPLCFASAVKFYTLAVDSASTRTTTTTNSNRKDDVALALARLAFLKNHGRPNIKVNQKQAELYKRTCLKLGTNGGLNWLIYAALHHQLPAAQLSLGICYYNGIGVQENDHSAFSLFMAAAEAGLSSAQNMVGNMYIEGTSSQMQDYSLALKWYIKAAEQKESAAMFNIGTMFEKGLGLDQDFNEAYSWYLRAAIYGSVIAYNALGIFHENGIGMDINHEEAVKWYMKGAQRGHPHSLYNLGRCFYDGCGASKNLTLALEQFELSAEQNHDRGTLATAICYEHGIGIGGKNKEKAIFYYKIAAARGSMYAKRRLAPIVAAKMLVPTRMLLRTKRPNFISRVDSKYFDEEKTESKPVIEYISTTLTTTDSSSYNNYNNNINTSKMMIDTLPTELLLHIVTYLNEDGLLTKYEVDSISRIASNEIGKSGYSSLNEYFSDAHVEAMPKPKCNCAEQECKDLVHLVDIFNF